MRAFPIVVLTGPRRAGKTFLLRHAFPRADYRLLEDPDVLARVREDPRGFLQGLGTPAILDEIQHAPELLPYLRTRVDEAPTRRGRFLLTGSQELALMARVTESLAGRAAVFQLLPLGLGEIPRGDVFLGGYPEVRLRPRSATTWFRSYVQTYLERDVRAVTAVRDLAQFRRFLALLATRNACLLNRAELAAPLGVSVPTISDWLAVLEVTGVILLVPPWYENLGKRLIKSPRVYFTDTGLLCHLLGLDQRAALERSALRGGVLEAFVCSELVKAQIHHGDPRAVYHFRDQQGLEVDLLVPRRDGTVLLVEVKHGRTVGPADARGIRALLPRFRQGASGVVVVPERSGRDPAGGVLVPGMCVATLAELPALVAGRRGEH